MKSRRWITSLFLLGLILTSGPGIARVLAHSGTTNASDLALADLPAGVVLSLPLDESAGATTFVDTSGQSNHGTCVGAACPEAGQTGKYDFAPHFDGAEDRVDTPLDIDQSSGSPGVTMVAWVYPQTVNNERNRYHVLSSDDGGFDWSILRRDHHWHVFTGEGDRDTGFGVQYNTWQHVAAVFAPARGRVRFYKNGREAIVPYLGYDGSDNPIAIGDNPGPWDEYFRGKIDEVQVYDRALSKAEVKAIYEGGSGSPDVPCNAGALVAAINLANASPGPDTLNLAAGCIYALATVDHWRDGPNGLPSITSEITINGNGATIQRPGGDNFRILRVAVEGDLTLSQVTIRGGKAVHHSGSGIYNRGILTLVDSTLTGNGAAFTDCGGLDNLGTATLKNSRVVGNQANRGKGGGLCNAGDMSLVDSTVNGNRAAYEGGGGILNSGTLTIQNGTISDNVVGHAISQGASWGDGGGIANSGTLMVQESTISGNTAYVSSGGIANSGTLTVQNSTISGNDASENYTREGTAGGIGNSGTMTVQNSTISGNHALQRGGGIANSGQAALENCTITANTAGERDDPGHGEGIDNRGTLTLRNTIVADQEEGVDCETSLGGDPITSLGYNLDSDGTCGLGAVGDQPNADPLLAPLGDYGGPTATHALLAGSPAIDQGNCPDATADQRGRPRPVDLPGIPNASDGCDIGAYEVQDQAPGGYLARVIVMNKGRERQAGYQITFYGAPSATGPVVATRTTTANGEADARLPNGQYSYVAQKDCYQSDPVNFTVKGQRVVRTHKTMVPVIVRVVDNAGIGRRGYLVRTYDAGGNQQWRATSTGSGRTRFTLDVLEQHQFTVERSQLQSQYHPIGDGVLCGPTEVRYTLATVEVRVTDAAGQPKGGYAVRVYHPGVRFYRIAYTRTNGVATLQLADGAYEYTVRKGGAISAPQGFTVDPPQGGPGGVADDQRIEHVLK